MQQTIADIFMAKMRQGLTEYGGPVTIDLRENGLDFYAVLTQDAPLRFSCRGLCYEASNRGEYTMKAADGTQITIDEKEYRGRLDYALSCIGAASVEGVGTLAKKHLKPL